MYLRVFCIPLLCGLMVSCNRSTIYAEDHQIFLDVAACIEEDWKSLPLLRGYELKEVSGAGLSDKIVIYVKCSNIKSDKINISNHDSELIKSEITKLVKRKTYNVKKIELHINKL